uniref:Uncharacterized protein n=1 Tax=Arundo donax TaxID=35708 RepID=A0A0A8YED3_ARUDO
MYCGDKYSYG